MIYESKASSRALVPALLVTILIPFIGWFIFGPWTFWNLFSNIRSRSYWITNQRIITEKKFFRMNRKVVQLQNVSDVRIHQGIMGRLLDYGSIDPIPMSGRTSGIGSKNLALIAIRSPGAVAETINKLVNEAQMKIKRDEFDLTEREIARRRMGKN